MNFFIKFFLASMVFYFACAADKAFAATITLPGSADGSRIKSEKPPVYAEQPDNISANAVPQSKINIPEAAYAVNFTLVEVKIIGANAFPESILRSYSAPYLGKEISLATIYQIANKITQHYKELGYFLALAYVPNQSIQNGIVTIQVVEGRIDKVQFSDGFEPSSPVKALLQKLTEQKPLRADFIESTLLQINDISDHSFRAVLTPSANGIAGDITLNLESEKIPSRRSVNVNNHGSRFIGPHMWSGTVGGFLLPRLQSQLSLSSSLPSDELKSISMNHAYIMAPSLKLKFNGSYNHSRPGFNLENFDIQSRSKIIGAEISYQYIRQRDQSLSLSSGFSVSNSDSKLLGGLLTKDRVRTIFMDADYDVTDVLQGANSLNLAVSHGIDLWNTSDRDYLYLSRAQANPNFYKAQITHNRTQAISNNWSFVTSMSGQIASSALFSSEEFGYGGQQFGRAYDSSEITGDSGISGSIELRYSAINISNNLNILPYGFYDIGRIWNKDIAQIATQSASSAGAGALLFADDGLSANLSIAVPLIIPAPNPIYGSSGHGVRLNIGFSRQF